MTDIELLELAAKAAGIEKDDGPYNGGGFDNNGFDCVGNMVLDWHNNKRWNPLIDDGDALRLVVALRFCVMRHEDGSTVSSPNGRIIADEVDLLNCNNPFAATRRAIVQAAAEIGRTMK